MRLDIPLMVNNITLEDREVMIDFLRQDKKLTHGEQVEAFEEEWSKWLGVKYSVMVNSGASANLLTMMIAKEHRRGHEVIVPPLTWVSDIASVIQNNMRPVFVDIDLQTLAMRTDKVIEALNEKTIAVFLTHVLGLNGLTETMLNLAFEDHRIPLIEDVCESHGATFNGRKLGTFGWISNFSFYYAHHLTTIEGGMICTDDAEVYNMARMCRSHGMLRESKDENYKLNMAAHHGDLNRDFIFEYPAWNVRPNELLAVLGRNQLKRLDSNIQKRNENFLFFLENLDGNKYQTSFKTGGCSNYALILVLEEKNFTFRDKVESALKEANVEFRRGLSGGGNQMRQPYWKNHAFDDLQMIHHDFQNVEHVHHFGWYIGNYPDLEQEKILDLCKLLNAL